MPKTKAEEKSIALVMKFERKSGRHPEKAKSRSGYDIKSGNRCIEVKGRTEDELPSEVKTNKFMLKSLGKNIKNYYVYIVFSIKKKPKLLILPSEVVFTNLDIDSVLTLNPKNIKKENPSLEILDL